eukprot:334236-Prorocentrum_lima.AAC.1
MSLAPVRRQQALGVISPTPVCHQQFADMPPLGGPPKCCTRTSAGGTREEVACVLLAPPQGA